jgi:hypothetical protein
MYQHKQKAAQTRPSGLARHLSIEMDAVNSTGRQRLEACIARKFDGQYGAKIQHFLPYLLSLNDSTQLDAVVGIRLAGESQLFLEKYMDTRIEQAISSVVRAPVDRGQVVEIGNLAAAAPGTASQLFAVLAIVLDRAGVRWVACTATPQVQVMLDKLNFPAHTLCPAEAAALGEDAQEWGVYYDSLPNVTFGDARVAAEVARANPEVRALERWLAEPIRQAATALRAARR